MPNRETQDGSRRLRIAAIAGVIRISLTGEWRGLIPGLRLQLPGRIAAAFPASGRRGRPSRPTPKSVMLGVIARAGRRDGWSDKHIAAALSRDPKALRRAEADVQRLERAEGVHTPNIPHDPKAFQALAYQRRQLKAASKRHKAENKVRALERARTEGKDGRGLEARISAAELDLRLRAGVLGLAIAKATGKTPESPLEPDENLKRWAECVEEDYVRRTVARVKNRNLGFLNSKELLANSHRDEILRIVEEQEQEERSEQRQRFPMPGSGGLPHAKPV